MREHPFSKRTHIQNRTFSITSRNPHQDLNRIIRGRPWRTSAHKGGESLSSADIFRTRGERVLQMRTSALFDAKNIKFFEIYGVPARTKEEGVNFSRFCADVFYGRPLKHKLANLQKFQTFSYAKKIMPRLNIQVWQPERETCIKVLLCCQGHAIYSL